MSEDIALAVAFYFGQVFVFCRLINKTELEWFLLIIQCTLNRLRREGCQMPNTEQLLYQTEKRSQQRFSIKTLFLKILQHSRENF